MDMLHYSFILHGKERIYTTIFPLETQEEILEWAERFGFISNKDIPYCTNVRLIPPEEVKQRNDALYKEWWEQHKNDESLCGKIPPEIAEVHLGRY